MIEAEKIVFLKLPDVIERVGISKPQIYKLIDRGEFPKPTKLGRGSAWPDTEVTAWQKARMAA